uniref:Uncharacterized protein n=1 Tax=Arundo donax TaxID=35708 RepID=A0A0A9B3U6_ARUDO
MLERPQKGTATVSSPSPRLQCYAPWMWSHGGRSVNN